MTAVASKPASAAARPERVAPRAPTWFRNPALIAGLTILGLLATACFGAGLFTSADPAAQDLTNGVLAPPGTPGHLLGTDQLGRDILSRLLYGGAVDMRIAFLAVLFPFTLGVTLGSIAGYFGGWVDLVIMRVIEIVVAFPFYVLVIALVFVLGPGARSIYIAITIVGWVAYARIVRGEILVAKRQEYVLAARSGGLSAVRIMGRHLLPNVISQAVVYAMSDIVQDIMAIVTLSYLGLGIQPPTPDWGGMINAGQTFLTTHWQLTTLPGIAVIVAGLGLSLTGDGLADLLRPGGR